MNKIKRIRKCTICAVLTLSMVISSSSFVEAKKINKQESVYVNAGADGSTTGITVSDRLMGADSANGTIQDISGLQDITNIKGEEVFSQDGKKVDWSAEGKDIYYQGQSSEELPVELKITYKLDGKEMTAKEMAGKSGHVEIHVFYKNKSMVKKVIDGKEETIYTPFVMVTGMILSSEKFENIEVENGRVINDGDNNMVVGMGMPGLAESLNLEEDEAESIPSDFIVTAEVTDFSMGNTFTFGSANLLNDLDLDDVEELDDLEEKLNDLTDAADKLVEGSDELSDNMKLFSGKMGELKSSMKTYQKDGVNKLAAGIRTLAKGTPGLVKGVGDYTKGVKQFANGTTQYVNGAAKITDGCTDLYESVKDLPTQVETFDTGLTAYTGAVDKMGTKENVTTMKNGAKAVSDGITTVNENLGKLEESYATTEALADEIIQRVEADGDSEAAEEIRTLKQVMKQQKEAIQALQTATGSESELKTGADGVSAGVDTVMDGLSTLSGKSASLTSASAQLKTGMPTLAAGAKKLKDGGEELAKSNVTLKKSSKKLVKSGKKLNTGAKKVGKGAKSLKKGSKSLQKATKKLSGGVLQLSKASGKLNKGSKTLAEGMSDFNEEGITKLNNVYEDDFKGLLDRLEAICDAGRDYRSFSGIHDSMDGEVKFIIETASIEKED